MSFAEVLSQERVVSILKGIVRTDRPANGYLFVGPQGCGKTLSALTFVKAINCREGKEDPCGICESCQKTDKGFSPDFYRLVYENTIKIEQIRELKRHVQHGPHQEKYLVVLIENAENFSKEAENSFLKLLEEPPANVLFIMETANKNILLPTIISRCQTILFDQLSEKALIQILAEKRGHLDDEKIKSAIKLSSCSLSLAEKILDQEEEVNEMISFFLGVQNSGLINIFKYAQQLAEDKEELKLKLQILIQYFINGLDFKKAKLLLNYLKLLKTNVNLRLAVEVMLLKFKELANA